MQRWGARVHLVCCLGCHLLVWVSAWEMVRQREPGLERRGRWVEGPESGQLATGQGAFGDLSRQWGVSKYECKQARPCVSVCERKLAVSQVLSLNE